MGRSRGSAAMPESRESRVSNLQVQPAAVAIAITVADAISTHSRCCCIVPEPTIRRPTPFALHYATCLLPVTDSRHKLRRIRI